MISTTTIDLDNLREILTKYEAGGRTNLLPALWEAQKAYGYLSEPVVTVICHALQVPLVDAYGVIEFYTMFYHEPVGHQFVRVCTSPMCDQLGGEAVLTSLCEHYGVSPGETTPDGRYTIEAVECLGLCDHAPAALVGDVPVRHISSDDIPAWIDNPLPAPVGEVGGEDRWLSGRVAVNDPTDIYAYQSSNGFVGLKIALKDMHPAEVIETIIASGLSGRGGAAFPTGLKWKFTAGVPGEARYVVCNADESEPGTFKDRVLMEGDPYFLIEGMVIAGYAIGSHKGYIYIRGEYPRATQILQEAIDTAVTAGFLGEDIMESGYDFDIEIRSGAGAYICGEETALFESIEGKRGFPRLKPPFPTTHGLFGQPTMINNVETLCAAAFILTNGPEQYRSLGTEKSPGTKLFCLSGDIVNPGVYEAPFGTPLKDLILMAGGVIGKLQGVLLGGAAGVFATPEQLDVPMSFEGLQEHDLSLGSGVVNVINTRRDMQVILHSLAHFFAHESCGKCYPCQLGTRRQLEIMTKIMAGKASKDDLLALEDVGYTMTNASLCGLGMTASTAILSAKKNWPQLFTANENGK